MPRMLPYGTWPSPLQPEDLAAGAIRPANLIVDGPRLLWTEARPAEDGRQAPVLYDDRRGRRDIGPPGFNARTRVHEYGGAPLVAHDGEVFASNFADQRLHRLTATGASPVTPEPPLPAGVRYADGQLSPDGRWLVAVRETHGADEPANEIVAVDVATGEVTVLVTGRDFVAAPRLSRDGEALAWLAWDHPSMPWDAAELHIGAFLDGTLSEPRLVGGGPGDAACTPVWGHDGRLLASFDGSGYWEVHRWDGTTLERLTRFGADVGFPAWQLGSSAIAPMADGRIACTVVERARCRVAVIDPADGAVEDVALPYVIIEGIQAYGGGIAFIGTEPAGAIAVASWEPVDGVREVQRIEVPSLRPGDHATAKEIVVSLPGGGTTHAFVYRPTNAEIAGPAGERPPLVVFTHGGPTGNAYPALHGQTAYWTTRGFAVVDVNYRGSTGYGREYRNALLRRWGEVDVEDTIAVARALAERGTVDHSRMAIRGGSAGGFTTLAVLTTPEHPFACGTSIFGVADLRMLAEHTHKFESRYLDRLVGPLPAAADTYTARSPLHRADQLSRPILILQGLEDRVVPPEQAEAIAAAAARRKIPHVYLAFEGEQHGFRRASTIVSWLQAELAFYGQVMAFTPAGNLPTLNLSNTDR